MQAAVSGQYFLEKRTGLQKDCIEHHSGSSVFVASWNPSDQLAWFPKRQHGLF